MIADDKASIAPGCNSFDQLHGMAAIGSTARVTSTICLVIGSTGMAENHTIQYCKVSSAASAVINSMVMTALCSSAIGPYITSWLQQ